MRCEEYELWLSAYLDDELAARDVPLLEGHLAGCDRCAQELASLNAGLRLTRTLVPEEPPTDLRQRIMTAIDASQPSLWSRLAILLRPSALRPAVGLSALGAAAGLVGLVALYRPAPSTAPGGVQRPSPAPRVSALPSATAQDHPAAHLAGAPKTTAQRVASQPKPGIPSSGEERVAPVFPPPTIPAAVATRPTPPAHEEIAGARTDPPASASARPHRGAGRRSRPLTDGSRMAVRPAPRSTRSSGSPPGMTPAPPPSADPYGAGGTSDPSSGDLASPTSANVAPDSSVDEPVTMMASMPMPSGAELEPTPTSDDELAALRQHLAVQRRELPSISLQSSRRSRRAIPPTFEF